MDNELLKKHIKTRLTEKVREFQARPDIVCSFQDPLVAYVSAEDDIFDSLFARGLNDHPKRIYRPGKCLIVHYTPFAEDFVRENGLCHRPTEKWVRAYTESLWLAMEMNSVIKDFLYARGRLTSGLNTMTEWNRQTCREKWSHKITAAIGEIGHIGPAGSIIVNGSFGGRAGGIITDGLYAEPHGETEDIKKRLAALTEPCLYEGPCSEEMISACPGCAISADGIDKLKCQEYCRTLNEHIPMPEVCGRCFRFGIPGEEGSGK